MHQAKGFINLEEENECVKLELAWTREEVVKACDECEERTIRCERMRTPLRNKSCEDRSLKHEQKCPLSPPKYTLSINPSELIAHLKG